MMSRTQPGDQWENRIFLTGGRSVSPWRIKREHDAFQELKVRSMTGKVPQQQGISLKGQLGAREGPSGKSIDFIYFERSL